MLQEWPLFRIVLSEQSLALNHEIDGETRHEKAQKDEDAGDVEHVLFV